MVHAIHLIKNMHSIPQCFLLFFFLTLVTPRVKDVNRFTKSKPFVMTEVYELKLYVDYSGMKT